MLGPGRTPPRHGVGLRAPRWTRPDMARWASASDDRGWTWPEIARRWCVLAPRWLPQNSLVSLSSSAYRQPDSQLPRVTVPPERRGGCSFSQSVNRDERADEPRSHSVIDTPAAPHAERTFRVRRRASHSAADETILSAAWAAIPGIPVLQSVPAGCRASCRPSLSGGQPDLREPPSGLGDPGALTYGTGTVLP